MFIIIINIEDYKPKPNPSGRLAVVNYGTWTWGTLAGHLPLVWVYPANRRKNKNKKNGIL